MARYPVIDQDQGLPALAACLGGDDVGPQTAHRGAGTDLSMAPVAKAAAQVRDLTTSPRWAGGPTNRPDQFEAEASALVFSDFESLGPEPLGDPDFWRWVALSEFQDLVIWRYKREDAKVQPYWFGVGGSNFSRCLPFSLFLRSLLVRSCSSDLAERLSLLNVYSTDLWQSHLFAVRTSNSPGLTRALLSAELDGRLDVPGVEKNKLIKATGRELNRLRSNVVAETIDLAASQRVFDMALARAKEALQ